MRIFFPFLFLFISFCLIAGTAFAQFNTQTVRGVVIDKISEKPLPGVTVRMAGAAGNAGTITDSMGRYELKGVPCGRLEFAFGCVGYTPVIIPEVLVTAGKEVVLDISLEQRFTNLKEATVSAPLIKKGALVNEMTAGSGLSFNLDDVTRFAGGRNDPSRLVSNFAGVAQNSDSRNDIVVRGNSPAGVLWQVQGSPAPNPNQFSTLGATGGPVSALNTNALKTSDFLTGAFPAEYGNALAAVFDISFRSGSSSKFEETFQLNLFSGLEVMVEGPLNSKNNGAAYLAGFRYSFVQIAQSVGINIGTKAVPKYQDWVFNVTTGKGRLGKFSFFGFGGLSRINQIGSQLDTTDFYGQTDQDAYFKSNFSMFGVQHNLDIGRNAYLRTVVSYTHTIDAYQQYQYPLPVPPYVNRRLQLQSNNTTNSERFSTYFNQKLSSRLSYRVGIKGEALGLNSLVQNKTGLPSNAPFDTITNVNVTPFLFQYFSEFRYRLTSGLTLTAGLHGMSYSLNGSKALEPRAALVYQLPVNQQVSLAYGMHSQIQPGPVYFQVLDQTTLQHDPGNRELGFTRAQHLVAGYENRFLPDWRLKVEAYYQWLYDVPVQKNPTGFSMLNAGADFGYPEQVGLVNKGTGFNRGIELTVEKFFNKGYYLLGTLSLFDSKYRGSDNVLRNTAFNYHYVSNLLAGKEWKMRHSGNAFTADIRTALMGGRYATPANYSSSKTAGYEIQDTLHYDSEHLSGYFRLDIRFGYRLNSSKRKVSQTFYFDLQNVTNRENIFMLEYNNAKAEIVPVYQIKFFPDILYRIAF